MNTHHTQLAAALALALGAFTTPAVHAAKPKVTETVLASMGSAQGVNPLAGLALGTDGFLYGVSSAGGSSGNGAVFKVSPAGAITVLHSFAGGASDGSHPEATLVLGDDGNFYGTTLDGGANGVGTVFRVTPTGKTTVLHAFAGGSNDGAQPSRGALVAGSDGSFYGTTPSGGANNLGVVYRITPTGELSVLHAFASSEGSNPQGTMIQAFNGAFYGTTHDGGPFGAGSVFKITPAGQFTMLVGLGATSTDAAHPYAGLTQGSDGVFYGVSYDGGAANLGAVFKVTPGGATSVLHSFSGQSDGANPQAELSLGSDGRFYGVADNGGKYAQRGGTMFSITPAGETVLYAFNRSSTDAASPFAPLLQVGPQNFFSTSYYGGASGNGTVYSVVVRP